MKIMITGTNGFLGSHLTIYLRNLFDETAEMISTSRSDSNFFNHLSIQHFDVDMLDKTKLKNLLNICKPNVIVHCAAMSKPDDCETNKELCYKINVESTEVLIDYSKEKNCHFIFLSTDFVFKEGENLSEESLPNPVNYYASTKLICEKNVQEKLLNYSIIRPVFMFGSKLNFSRGSFIQWVLENLKSQKQIKVVNDQFRTPTFVEDVCFVIAKLIEHKTFGLFHVCGDEIFTPYEMAILIAKFKNFDTNLISPVSQNEFKELALRPQKMILSNQKIKEKLNFTPLKLGNFIEKMIL